MSYYEGPNYLERDRNLRGNILYFINQYPGYGYNAGGAERHLQLLTGNLIKKYPDTYTSKTFVAQSPSNELSAPQADIISDKSMFHFLQHVHKHQNEIDILHLGNFNLLKRVWPFVALNTFWEKPIITRVTSTGRMEKLLAIPSIGRLYTKKITRFVSQSEEITDQLRQLGVEPDRIVNIDNGVDTSFFVPASNEDEKMALRQQLLPGISNGTTFINVGRVSKPEKKVDELLDAWENTGLYKGNTLVLAGPIEEKSMTESMKQYYQKFRDPQFNVVWTDSLPHQGVRDFLQASDVFVTASNNEGFSNAALEAMACSLPVIGRHGVSGHSKIIQEGITGMYFHDNFSLENALLATTDYGYRQLLGENALSLVNSRYTIDNMVNQYHELYQTTLAKSR